MLNMGSLDPNFDSILVFNMIFHFLFQELKDSSAVRRYITRKLNIEFKEILTTKTAGKLVDRITVGSLVPDFDSLSLFEPFDLL